MAAKNWHVRIAEARKKGFFITWDRAAAQDWFSCACGELDARIPRRESGAPVDTALMDLGTEFYRSVRDDNLDRAANLLQKIEVREAELLAELGEAQ